MGRRQLITSDEAVEAHTQHEKPCSDCPFARTALAGWLGGSSPEEYRQLAHADTIVDCHAIKDKQCAGLAIYRANVCKRPPDGALKLPADRTAVFATPMEFLEHHERSPVCCCAGPNYDPDKPCPIHPKRRMR